MAAIEKREFTKNLPNITFKLYEGVATIQDVFDQSGMKIDTTVVWNAQIAKKDVVKIYPTGNVSMTVEKLAVDDDDAVGVVVDDPVYGKMTPITGVHGANVTPTAAQRRSATVALFGAGVTQLKNDGSGAISAGAVLGWSNTTPGNVEAGTPLQTGNRNLISLGYSGATAGFEIPVLVGYFGFAPNLA